MSIDQIDEYEQGERVRTWLKNNGSSLITGIALGIAAISGWNWWQAKGDGHRSEAASQYALFTDAITAKNAEKVKTFAAALNKDFADTPYAVLTLLRHAEFLQAQGKNDQALAVLNTLGSAPSDPVLADLVSLRAARLLVNAGKFDDAIKRVDSVKPASFPAIANEIRGDAELGKGNRDAARKAYETAVANLDVAAPTRPLLELKLTDSGGELPEQPEI